MLQTQVEFPYPGSIAEYEGKRWRVLQHLPGRVALLSADGNGASFTRRAPIADLVDPDLATFSTAGLDEMGLRTMRWPAVRLKPVDRIAYEELKQDLWTAASIGQANYQAGLALVGLLRRLGWRRLRREHRYGSTVTIWHRLEQQALAA